MEDDSTIRWSKLLILCAKYDAERMKPETKKHISSDSISKKHKKDQIDLIFSHEKLINDGLRVGADYLGKHIRETFKIMEHSFS